MKTRLYNNDQCMSFRNCFYMSVGKTNMPVTAGNRYNIEKSFLFRKFLTDETQTVHD
jgi:hypothetical protein